MKIKKKISKPTVQTVEVDSIVIETVHGSQSTDYTLTLYDGKNNEILVKDLRSIDDGVNQLIKLLNSPNVVNEE